MLYISSKFKMYMCRLIPYIQFVIDENMQNILMQCYESDLGENISLFVNYFV